MKKFMQNGFLNGKLKSTKKNVIYALLFSTIALIMTNNFVAFPVYAQSDFKIFLDPSRILYDSSDASVDTLFNVTVKVEDVSDLACFEVKMYYDDSMINVTRWYEPTDDPEYVFHGKDTITVCGPPSGPGFYEHVDLSNGSAHVGSALFPAPTAGGGFHGDGILCIFEFKIISVPTVGTYSCPIQIDNDDTYLLTSEGEDMAGVIRVDGYYQYKLLDITDPIAEAGPDQTVHVNTPVSLDASGSSDNIGIVSYEWDFGNVTTGTGVTTTHIYTESGTYTVTLTVKDAAGNTATDTVTITVEAEQAPASPQEPRFPLWMMIILGVLAMLTVVVLYVKVVR